MDTVGAEPALRRFAAEVADPAAQKIAGVLILRERHGGPGLADVLTELAADVEDRARMLRDVESERTRARANARTIVILTAAMVLGMLFFTRTFLASYSGPLGQLLLAGVAGVFVVALRWLRRLSDPPPEPPVLTDPAGAGAS
jgi:Flp pilus assembly protein TadB